MKNNIENNILERCFGCGLCVKSCHKDAISMKKNALGFWYPSVNDKCVNCGVCLKICPASGNCKSNKLLNETFAARLNDVEEVKKSASGGVAYSLMRYGIQNGYIVYGAKYSDHYKKCEYHRASSSEDIQLLRGTKYSQAELCQSIEDIRNDIANNKKVMFIGTPCYVGAVHSKYGNNSNLILVELICSGVMPPKIEQDFFDKYRNKLKADIDFFSVKYKKHGFEWPYVLLKCKNYKYDNPLHCTEYGYCYRSIIRECCYSCCFKGDNSKADITIGDYWGYGKTSDVYSNKGVSAVILRNDKGKDLFMKLDDVVFVETQYKCLVKNNPRIESSRIKNKTNDAFIKIYLEKGYNSAIKKTISLKDVLLNPIKHILAIIER